MSSFWNIWVWVLTLGTLVGMYLLLRWCLKNFAGVKEGESLGHSFDGIEELNHPLPKWWSTFFLLTIIWAFGYIAMYGLGNWTGLLGWKSSNQGIMNLAESKAKTAEYLAVDSGVLHTDRGLFVRRCLPGVHRARFQSAYYPGRHVPVVYVGYFLGCAQPGAR